MAINTYTCLETKSDKNDAMEALMGTFIIQTM